MKTELHLARRVRIELFLRQTAELTSGGGAVWCVELCGVYDIFLSDL